VSARPYYATGREFTRAREGGVRVQSTTMPSPAATIPQLHGRIEVWLIGGQEFRWRRPGQPPKAMRQYVSQDDDGIWFVDPEKLPGFWGRRRSRIGKK